MGIFDFFFTKTAAEAPVYNSEAVKYDSKGAPIFEDNKVLAINLDKADDFVQVDFRSLSYAEVAALRNANTTTTSKSNVVDINSDLGTDITDYQLAEAIQKSLDSRDIHDKSTLKDSNASDDLLDFADRLDLKKAHFKRTVLHNKRKHY